MPLIDAIATPLYALVPAAVTLLDRLIRKHEITVNLSVPESTDRVCIVGNLAQLGEWDPGLIEMQQTGATTWRHSMQVRHKRRIEFKITRGSWETEAVDRQGRVMPNFQLVATQSSEIALKIPGWRDHAAELEESATSEQDGRVVSGRLHRHHQAGGSRLQPRDILVWLPPGYEASGTKRYPVLYMHDGQNLFDARTSYTGVEWRVDETVTALSADGRIREIIVVGIENTPDRLEEYAWTPLGEQYLRFIVDRVKPFVDKRYRTLPGRDHCATAGSSMGGLVSFRLVWQHPEVFSKAGCLSPSFIYNRGRPIRKIRRCPSPQLPVSIYIDCGGAGGEKLLLKGCRRVVRLLRRRGLREGVDFTFYHDPEGNHSESAWAARLWRPLEFMFRREGRKKTSSASGAANAPGEDASRSSSPAPERG